MAKYDNLLEQDLFELFGQEFLEKVIEKEAGEPLTDIEKKRVYKVYRADGDDLMKAVLLLGLIQLYTPNDKELKDAYEKQNIGRLLATE